MSTLGVVVIGRNEGLRLKACLLSVVSGADAIVYVDSGSTDDSLSIAQSFGVATVELDDSAPFTAARARNTGFEALIQKHPGIQWVQFVDGDCQIVSTWLSGAMEFLKTEDDVAVVAGRRRELQPDRSVYNKLCDIEWDTPIGEVGSCGGDALIRASVFNAAGGFNPSLIAGEEPDLCLRIRSAGWKVHRIDSEMTLHDASLTKLSQWWKRTERSGYAYAQAFHLHQKSPHFSGTRQIAGVVLWGLVIPVILCASLILSILVDWRWTWVFLSCVGFYGVLIVRVMLDRRSRGSSLGSSLLYGCWVLFGKFPQLVGLLSFLYALRTNRQRSLIEYK